MRRVGRADNASQNWERWGRWSSVREGTLQVEKDIFVDDLTGDSSLSSIICILSCVAVFAGDLTSESWDISLAGIICILSCVASLFSLGSTRKWLQMNPGKSKLQIVLDSLKLTGRMILDSLCSPLDPKQDSGMFFSTLASFGQWDWHSLPVRPLALNQKALPT